VTQGEPDTLTATATVAGADWAGALGLCEEAAWSLELGQRVKQWALAGEGRVVIIATDRDSAGERYAASVRASLCSGVSGGRAAGEAGRGNLNDLWRAFGSQAVAALLDSRREMPAPPTAEDGCGQTIQAHGLKTRCGCRRGDGARAALALGWMIDQPAGDRRDDSANAEDNRETAREIAEEEARFLGRQSQACISQQLSVPLDSKFLMG
jgi:hypothetical protein